jgi:hypothetical protein
VLSRANCLAQRLLVRGLLHTRDSRVNTRRKATMQNPQRTLRVVEARGTENVVDAPPVLIASSHTIDYLCGNCRTVLLHAEDDQVHGLFIHCTQCGACNATAD